MNAIYIFFVGFRIQDHIIQIKADFEMVGCAIFGVEGRKSKVEGRKSKVESRRSKVEEN